MPKEDGKKDMAYISRGERCSCALKVPARGSCLCSIPCCVRAAEIRMFGGSLLRIINLAVPDDLCGLYRCRLSCGIVEPHDTVCPGAGYDATSHFETTVEDVLDMYQRITGKPLDLQTQDLSQANTDV